MLSLSEFFEERVVALVSDRTVDFTLDLRHSARPGVRDIRAGEERSDEAMPAGRQESYQEEILPPPQLRRGQNDRKTLFRNSLVFSLSDEQKTFFQHSADLTIERAAWAKQVHGTRILDVSREFLKHEELLEADGLLTGDLHLPIAVRTADCLSVFIFDPAQKAIGLLHAGWRGSREGILQRALERMTQTGGSKAEDFKIAFGPSIRSCCYQVGEEFKGYFPHEVQRKESGYYLDLVLANRNQLRAAGVKDQNIFDCGICTCCDESFFSYRREGEKAGRMISLMMLKS